MTSADLIAVGLLALQGGFVFIMVIYFVSGVDDLFVDVLFVARFVAQPCAGDKGRNQPSVEQLAAKPEQPLALMFPAWQEAAVIRQALTATIANIQYRNFHVFVGTYINDLDTQREVEAVMRQHDNVSQIVVPHPGPTCKADCLNWVVKGIREFQQQHGIAFAGVILHDAEDVVDPLSLKLFNWMMPEYDLVQIPIISLKRRWSSFTGGHYMDEFAEAHCKEIHVREWFAGIVPGAGVGTGYSMRAIETSAAHAGGDAFATDSLTEDYDFSFRVHEFGLKQTFVRLPITRREQRPSRWRRRPREVVRHDFITTREFFPDAFWASVRQKTRWVIGIAFQGARKFGWRGSWRVRYLYFRDRKAVLTQQFLVLGYVVFLGLAGLQLSSILYPEHYIFAPPLANDSPLWYLFYANVALLANRLVQRHIWTCRIYGWSQLPLVIPRYILANVVNYLAVTRATLRYLKHRRTGERIGWDKTAHTYPGEDVLAAYRRRLGDALLERGLISDQQLARGLAAKAENGRPLGAALVDIGALDEGELIDVLCDQLRIAPAETVFPDSVAADLLRRLPQSCAKAFSVFPIGTSEDGRILLACAVLPSRDGIREIETTAGAPVRFRLARRADVAYALRFGYARPEGGGADHAQESESPPRGYRPIGELLVDLGAVAYPDLAAALPEAARSGRRLGEYLLAEGRIEQAQLDEALAHQRLGENRPPETVAAIARTPTEGGHVVAVD